MFTILGSLFIDFHFKSDEKEFLHNEHNRTRIVRKWSFFNLNNKIVKKKRYQGWKCLKCRKKKKIQFKFFANQKIHVHQNKFHAHKKFRAPQKKSHVHWCTPVYTVKTTDINNLYIQKLSNLTYFESVILKYFTIIFKGIAQKLSKNYVFVEI